MAQLVKCYDFVTRYQNHLNRYVNQYVQNKARRWEAYKSEDPDLIKQEKFYDTLFKHQITWATSTNSKRSLGIDKLKRDVTLKEMLRWFGDTGLLFYHPILTLEEAEVETDLVLITPSVIWVMVCLKGESGSVFQGQSRRQWTEVRSEGIRKLVNPLITLSRSTEVIKRCFLPDIEHLPIKSALIVPESYVEYAVPDKGIEIVDKIQFPAWLKSVEPYRASFKSLQLKNVSHLLSLASTKADTRV